MLRAKYEIFINPTLRLRAYYREEKERLKTRRI